MFLFPPVNNNSYRTCLSSDMAVDTLRRFSVRISAMILVVLNDVPGLPPSLQANVGISISSLVLRGRSQMDVKRKVCDIPTGGKHLFLDISSTNIDTLAPSLYQCFVARSIEAF
jgi:hypothetical protein